MQTPFISIYKYHHMRSTINRKSAKKEKKIIVIRCKNFHFRIFSRSQSILFVCSKNTKENNFEHKHQNVLVLFYIISLFTHTRSRYSSSNRQQQKIGVSLLEWQRGNGTIQLINWMVGGTRLSVYKTQYLCLNAFFFCTIFSIFIYSID